MTFPLLEAALRFFNHPDNLIKTSVRTITLQILTVYSLAEESVKDQFELSLLSLPYVQFWGNLAMQLKEVWIKIDDKVQSLTNDEVEIEQIFNWVEDQNETLMFVADIMEIPSLSGSVKAVIMNSLLTIAYLPEIISSLVLINPKLKKRSLNTCIFILIQTFKVFRATSMSGVESSLNFLKILAYCLFCRDKVPKELNIIIWDGVLGQKQEKYLARWPSQRVSEMDRLHQYICNYFTDLSSFQVFLERYI